MLLLGHKMVMVSWLVTEGDEVVLEWKTRVELLQIDNL